MNISPLDAWIHDKTGSPVHRLSAASLLDYQFRKLRDTIVYARDNSPFYRAHLRVPDYREPVSLADITRFPFTTEAHLRAEGPRFVCTPQSRVERVVTLRSSGTTGLPKRLFFSAADLELTVDFFHRGMSAIAAPGDRVLILFPGERPDGIGDLLGRGLLRLGAAPVQHGFLRDPASTLALMKHEAITCVAGLPTQVMALARSSVEAGYNMKVKTAVLSGDHLPRAVIRELEELWNCQAYGHYGMTEMGLGGGVECSARNGYHLREADLFFEIVDPVTGTPLPDGIAGEVVFTTLTREAMPLIRYRTGDISRFIPGPCPCGSVLRRLERLRSRPADTVPMADGGRLSMAALDDALFSLPGVLDFEAFIDSSSGRDLLGIRLESSPFRPADPSAVLNALKTIPELCAAELSILPTPRIERRPGEKRRLEDRRPSPP